jgi:hypothetical protein
MNCSRVILIFINQIFSKYMKASRIISIIVLCTAFSMLTAYRILSPLFIPEPILKPLPKSIFHPPRII